MTAVWNNPEFIRNVRAQLRPGNVLATACIAATRVTAGATAARVTATRVTATRAAATGVCVQPH